MLFFFVLQLHDITSNSLLVGITLHEYFGRVNVWTMSTKLTLTNSGVVVSESAVPHLGFLMLTIWALPLAIILMATGRWSEFRWPPQTVPNPPLPNTFPVVYNLQNSSGAILALSFRTPEKNQKNNELISHCGFQIHAWSKYLISLRQRQERYQQTIKRLATWNFWMKYTGKTISENKAKQRVEVDSRGIFVLFNAPTKWRYYLSCINKSWSANPIPMKSRSKSIQCRHMPHKNVRLIFDNTHKLMRQNFAKF